MNLIKHHMLNKDMGLQKTCLKKFLMLISLNNRLIISKLSQNIISFQQNRLNKKKS